MAVRSIADPDYVARKFATQPPRLETYVFMEGHFYKGMTVDPSMRRLTFKELARSLGSELARQRYVPAPALESADLLLVVHWGTTVPYIGLQEMAGRTSWSTDGSNTSAGLARTSAEEIARALPGDETGPLLTTGLQGETSDDLDRQGEFDALNLQAEILGTEASAKQNVQLLGYSRELGSMGGSLSASEKERTLRHDLTSERYFLIIRAYDLVAARESGEKARAVWTVYTNISGPGNNGPTAITRMAGAAVDFYGRDMNTVTTVRFRERTGTVIIEPSIILGTSD